MRSNYHPPDMCLQHRERSERLVLGETACIRWWYSWCEAPGEWHLGWYPYSEEGEDFETSRRGRSKDGLWHPLGYFVSASALLIEKWKDYQKGFNTDLHGGLQITGSNCKTGVSGISFRGVYKAPIGTTKREASYKSSVKLLRGIVASTDHSRTREDIPTESKTISIFNLTPLLLQSLNVHFDISPLSIART